LFFEKSAHRTEGNLGGASGGVTGEQRETDDDVTMQVRVERTEDAMRERWERLSVANPV
jgi:GMP synthase PP-ATPase subunit